MKYIELKQGINNMVREHKSHGASQDEAEARVLKASLAMLNDQKLGIVDVVLIFHILGYDFHGDMAKQMEEAKKAFRKTYGLDEGIKNYQNKGFKEDLAVKAVIRDIYDTFMEGDIEGPEMVDGLLWALGYRLEEKFYLDYYQGKKPMLAYEEDE